MLTLFFLSLRPAQFKNCLLLKRVVFLLCFHLLPSLGWGEDASAAVRRRARGRLGVNVPRWQTSGRSCFWRLTAACKTRAARSPGRVLFCLTFPRRVAVAGRRKSIKLEWRRENPLVTSIFSLSDRQLSAKVKTNPQTNFRIRGYNKNVFLSFQLVPLVTLGTSAERNIHRL